MAGKRKTISSITTPSLLNGSGVDSSSNPLLIRECESFDLELGGVPVWSCVIPYGSRLYLGPKVLDGNFKTIINRAKITVFDFSLQHMGSGGMYSSTNGSSDRGLLFPQLKTTGFNLSTPLLGGCPARTVNLTRKHGSTYGCGF
jgi:hypothetical protein